MCVITHNTVLLFGYRHCNNNSMRTYSSDLKKTQNDMFIKFYFVVCPWDCYTLWDGIPQAENSLMIDVSRSMLSFYVGHRFTSLSYFALVQLMITA